MNGRREKEKILGAASVSVKRLKNKGQWEGKEGRRARGKGRKDKKGGAWEVKSTGPGPACENLRGTRACREGISNQLVNRDD